MAGVAIGVSPIGQILHHESGSKPPWLRGVTLLPLPHFRPPSGAESGPLASERDTPIATPAIGIGSAGVTGCPQRRVPFDAFGAFVREVGGCCVVAALRLVRREEGKETPLIDAL